jgi:hypothetical protein
MTCVERHHFPHFPFLPEFGVRSEVNVFVDAAGQVHVTGGLQTEVLAVV